MLGTAGAVWIRRIEGRWLVCHVCIPEWSSIRSTPSWAISVIRDEDFRRSAILASAVDDVGAGERSPEHWATEGRTWDPAPWDLLSVAKIAAMFDAALRTPMEGEAPRFIFPESWLDLPGWVALQQILLAMLESGVSSPSAVVVRDSGWNLPAQGLPAEGIYEFRRDAPARKDRPGQPVARGVEVCSFLGDFSSCRDLMSAVTAAASASSKDDDGRPGSFAEAVAPCVPLSVVDPSRIRRDEWVRWAAETVRALGGSDAISRRAEDLVRRIERGESDLVSPVLRLLAAGQDREISAHGDSRPSRAASTLEDWIARISRPQAH